MNDELLSRDAAAQYLGVSSGTLANWRHKGTGPKSWRNPAGKIVYPLSGLVEFVDSLAEQSEK